MTVVAGNQGGVSRKIKLELIFDVTMVNQPAVDFRISPKKS